VLRELRGFRGQSGLSWNRLLGMVKSMSIWSVAAAAVLWGAGCTHLDGPSTLTIPASGYEAAFDAAVQTAIEHGMSPVIRDREGGHIQTDVGHVPSLLEPWRTSSPSVDVMTAATMGSLRRRATIWFTLGEVTSPPEGVNDVLGQSLELIEVGDPDAPVTVQVRVLLERVHEPGIRRDTWSRRLTTRSQRIAPDETWQETPEVFWSAYARDTATERAVLARVLESVTNSQQE
jgi:hypothetical protein